MRDVTHSCCLSASLMTHRFSPRRLFVLCFSFFSFSVFSSFSCLHSDEEELRKSFSELGDSLCESSTSRSMKRVASGGRPLSDEAQPPGTPLYKNGFLVRKVHADPDGKRSTGPGHFLRTAPGLF